MFKFFKRKSADKDIEGIPKDAQSSLTYYVKDDGEIFIDINLEDYSEETLGNFSKILAGISSLRFQLQTIDVVKHGFLESGRVKEFEQLLILILHLSRQDVEEVENYIDKKAKEEEPCIKPSDML
jgi:hypothetical protein